jgi:hypothetical protein
MSAITEARLTAIQKAFLQAVRDKKAEFGLTVHPIHGVSFQTMGRHNKTFITLRDKGAFEWKETFLQRGETRYHAFGPRRGMRNKRQSTPSTNTYIGLTVTPEFLVHLGEPLDEGVKQWLQALALGGLMALGGAAVTGDLPGTGRPSAEQQELSQSRTQAAYRKLQRSVENYAEWDAWLGTVAESIIGEDPGAIGSDLSKAPHADWHADYLNKTLEDNDLAHLTQHFFAVLSDKVQKQAKEKLRTMGTGERVSKWTSRQAQKAQDIGSKALEVGRQLF